MSNEDPHNEVVQCHHDDTIEAVRIKLIYASGLFVIATPALYLILQFCAALSGKTLVLDERILLCSLAGLASMIAFGFKGKNQ